MQRRKKQAGKCQPVMAATAWQHTVNSVAALRMNDRRTRTRQWQRQATTDGDIACGNKLINLQQQTERRQGAAVTTAAIQHKGGDWPLSGTLHVMIATAELAQMGDTSTEMATMNWLFLVYTPSMYLVIANMVDL